MGGCDCAGVFRSFLFTFCNACFCFPPINDPMSSRCWGTISVLASSVFLCSTTLRFLCCIFAMLDRQDEGSSKQTCMVCVSAFHQNPVANPDPTFMKPISRSASHTIAENGCLRFVEVEQMRHLIHCGALRVRNRALPVLFGNGWLGLLSCACCSACEILNCELLDLASVLSVVPFSDSRSIRPSYPCRK